MLCLLKPLVFAVPSYLGRRCLPCRPCWEHSGGAAHADENTRQLVSSPVVALVALRTFHQNTDLDVSTPGTQRAPTKAPGKFVSRPVRAMGGTGWAPAWPRRVPLREALVPQTVVTCGQQPSRCAPTRKPCTQRSAREGRGLRPAAEELRDAGGLRRSGRPFERRRRRPPAMQGPSAGAHSRHAVQLPGRGPR